MIRLTDKIKVVRGNYKGWKGHVIDQNVKHFKPNSPQHYNICNVVIYNPKYKNIIWNLFNYEISYVVTDIPTSYLELIKEEEEE